MHKRQIIALGTGACALVASMCIDRPDGDRSSGLVAPVRHCYSEQHSQDYVNADFCADVQSVSVSGAMVPGASAWPSYEIAFSTAVPVVPQKMSVRNEPFYARFVRSQQSYWRQMGIVNNRRSDVRYFRRGGSGGLI